MGLGGQRVALRGMVRSLRDGHAVYVVMMPEYRGARPSGRFKQGLWLELPAVWSRRDSVRSNWRVHSHS